MRITAIPQSFRNMKRTTEIISVLSKYGLADWMSRLPLDQLGLEFIKGVLRAPTARPSRSTATKPVCGWCLPNLVPCSSSSGRS